MKLTNGISLFNKQSSKVQKNRKNDILDKNCNFSIPIIENEISNHNKNFSKEKVTLLKSFYSKNEKTSKSKSKSNSHSKEYRRRNRSNLNYNNNFNNIKNKNVYYNNNTSYNQNKNKYIFNSYIVTPLYGLKIYEKTINKLFEYIKGILPKKIFLEIKKVFIRYVLEELHIKNNIANILFAKSESEIINLNLKLFYNKDNKSSSVNRSSSKNSRNKSRSKSKKKNPKDFSFTRNYNNKGINLKTRNSKTAKNNISKQYIFNELFNHHHNLNHNSLYTLSKNYRIPGMPFTLSVTKSSIGKSRSKSGSKEKKIVNKNTNKNYYSNNNIFDPDAHVYKILNQKKSNNDNNNLGIKNRNNTSNNNKVQKQITNNLLLNNKKSKKNISSKGKSAINNLVNSDKKKENMNNNKKIFKKETKDKTKENQEENKNNENEKENKNEEQLKQIKSGLDENLKYLFNFSYENFLNKESENDSKKTVSEYNNNV
jgi:hypothetical protein